MSNYQTATHVSIDGIITSTTIADLRNQHRGAKALRFTGLDFENQQVLTEWTQCINECPNLQFLEIDLANITDPIEIKQINILFIQTQLFPFLHLVNTSKCHNQLIDYARNASLIFKVRRKGKTFFKDNFNSTEVFEHAKNSTDAQLAIYLCQELLKHKFSHLTKEIEKQLAIRYIQLADLSNAFIYLNTQLENDLDVQNALLIRLNEYESVKSYFPSKEDYWRYYLDLATLCLKLNDKTRKEIEKKALAALIPTENNKYPRVVRLTDVQDAVNIILLNDEYNIFCITVKPRLQNLNPLQILRLGQQEQIKEYFNNAFGSKKSRFITIEMLLNPQISQQIVSALNHDYINTGLDSAYMTEITFISTTNSPANSGQTFYQRLNEQFRELSSKRSEITGKPGKINPRALIEQNKEFIAEEFKNIAIILFGMAPAFYGSIINTIIEKAGLDANYKIIQEFQAGWAVDDLKILKEALEQNPNIERLTFFNSLAVPDLREISDIVKYYTNVVYIKIEGFCAERRYKDECLATFYYFLSQNPNVKRLEVTLRYHYDNTFVYSINPELINNDQTLIFHYTISGFSNQRDQICSRFYTGKRSASPQKNMGYAQNVHCLLHSNPEVLIDKTGLASLFAKNGRLVLSFYWLLKTNTYNLELIKNIGSAILALTKNNRDKIFGSNVKAFQFIICLCAHLNSNELDQLPIDDYFSLLPVEYKALASKKGIKITQLSSLQEKITTYIQENQNQLGLDQVAYLSLLSENLDKLRPDQLSIVLSKINQTHPNANFPEPLFLIRHLLYLLDEFKEEEPEVGVDVLRIMVVKLSKNTPVLSPNQSVELFQAKCQKELAKQYKREFDWFNILYSRYCTPRLGFTETTGDQKPKSQFEVENRAYIEQFYRYCVRTAMLNVTRSILVNMALTLGLFPIGEEFEQLVNATATNVAKILSGNRNLVLNPESQVSYHNTVMLDSVRVC